ncbi:hypothetical protein G7Y89_g5521 [Cudoniella acicularis]|uniref:Uncharacterized protein n=1 Tax=Cudoniella acicularis TaxID=354080 RepID=A0A8H4W5M9_9HELO|nr:hypothetical protein G7Y89_g5521 [Cudoniella acicularis]
MPINEDTSTSSNDSNDDIIDVISAKRPSNSSKRSFKTANNEVDNYTILYKRPKGDKDTTLPDSQYLYELIIRNPKPITLSERTSIRATSRRFMTEEEAKQMTKPDVIIVIIGEDIEEMSQPDLAIVIMDEGTEQTIKTASTIVIDEVIEQTAKTDSVIEIIDDDTEKMTKPRRKSPRNAVKRSFKDFVVNNSL